MIKEAKVSEYTKNNYRSTCKALFKLTGKKAEEAMRDVEGTMKEIEKIENVGTQHTYVKNINGMMGKMGEDWKECKEKWEERSTPIYAAAREQQGKNKGTPEQRKNMMKWEEVLEAREGMKKGGQDHLLMCLHTMIKPVRADFDRIKIYRAEDMGEERKKICEAIKEGTSAEEMNQMKKEAKLTPPNFMVQEDGEGMTIYMTEFKTANVYGAWSKRAPAELEEVVKKSLTARPREYLITTKKGEPYQDGDDYAQYASGVMKRACKKDKMGVTLMRRIYITSLDHNKMTHNEKQEVAREMMTSVIQVDKYRTLADAYSQDETDTDMEQEDEVEQEIHINIEQSPARHRGEENTCSETNGEAIGMEGIRKGITSVIGEMGIEIKVTSESDEDNEVRVGQFKKIMKKMAALVEMLESD